jgi:hypothetical protein
MSFIQILSTTLLSPFNLSESILIEVMDALKENDPIESPDSLIGKISEIF